MRPPGLLPAVCNNERPWRVVLYQLLERDEGRLSVFRYDVNEGMSVHIKSSRCHGCSETWEKVLFFYFLGGLFLTVILTWRCCCCFFKSTKTLTCDVSVRMWVRFNVCWRINNSSAGNEPGCVAAAAASYLTERCGCDRARASIFNEREEATHDLWLRSLGVVVRHSGKRRDSLTEAEMIPNTTCFL